MTRWLITGGCGFIGAHLARSLVAAGMKVRILDDLSNGRRDAPPGTCEIRIGSVTDPVAVASAMEGVDGCFHLAAIASVQRSVEDWVGTHRTNLTGTVTILDAARGALTPVVYASSAAVYGAVNKPQHEDLSPEPLTAYGADKFGSELHARIASRLHGVPTLGLRFFNVYGPGQAANSPYSGVISLFADRLRRGLPLRIHGSGEQTRDFVEVEDVVRFLRAAMARADDSGMVLNVCTGRPTSVLTLARTMHDLIQPRSPFRPQFAPGRPGDIPVSSGRPERAVDVLGMRADTPLEAGLRRLLDGTAQPVMAGLSQAGSAA